MDQAECQRLIEQKLAEKSIKIRNRNAIEAFLKLFPPLSSLWQVLIGSKQALETERGEITQELILDMVVAMDKKLSQLEYSAKDQKGLEVLIEGVQAYGDVTGIDANTSNPILREIFSSMNTRVAIKNVQSGGNVTALKLNVDAALPLKKKLEVSGDSCSVKFTPTRGGEIIFGKGLKKN